MGSVDTPVPVINPVPPGGQAESTVNPGLSEQPASDLERVQGPAGNSTFISGDWDKTSGYRSESKGRTSDYHIQKSAENPRDYGVQGVTESSFGSSAASGNLRVDPGTSSAEDSFHSVANDMPDVLAQVSQNSSSSPANNLNGEGSKSPGQCKKILLSNLPNSWTDREFGHLVRQIGQVVAHQSLKRNKALYTFHDIKEAAEAVRLLNGKVVNGNAIKVEFDKFLPQADRNNNRNQSAQQDQRTTTDPTATGNKCQPGSETSGHPGGPDAGKESAAVANAVASVDAIGTGSTAACASNHAADTDQVFVDNDSSARGAVSRYRRGGQGQRLGQRQQRVAVGRQETEPRSGDNEISVIRLVLPSCRIGALIGRRGENIRRILFDSNAVSIRALPEIFPWSEQVVEIHGLFDNCATALRKILEREMSALSTAGIRYGDQVELRVLVPDRYCGQLIGRSGRDIKLVREETETKINISKLLQLMELYPERMMTIHGEVVGVVSAEAKMRSRLAELTAASARSAAGDGRRYGQRRFIVFFNESEMSYRIEIRDQYAGRLIGEYGTNIKNMMRDTGAYIAVEPRMHEIAEYSHSSNMSRWVHINGSPEAIFRASYAIFDMLSQCVKNKHVYTYFANSCIEIPRVMVGRVIGRYGQKVKYIQQSTGVDISISRDSRDTDDVTVHITGCLIGSQKALQHIREIVTYSQRRESSASLPAPSTQYDQRERHQRLSLGNAQPERLNRFDNNRYPARDNPRWERSDHSQERRNSERFYNGQGQDRSGAQGGTYVRHNHEHEHSGQNDHAYVRHQDQDRNGPQERLHVRNQEHTRNGPQDRAYFRHQDRDFVHQDRGYVHQESDFPPLNRFFSGRGRGYPPRHERYANPPLPNHFNSVRAQMTGANTRGTGGSRQTPSFALTHASTLPQASTATAVKTPNDDSNSAEAAKTLRANEAAALIVKEQLIRMLHVTASVKEEVGGVAASSAVEENESTKAFDETDPKVVATSGAGPEIAVPVSVPVEDIQEQNAARVKEIVSAAANTVKIEVSEATVPADVATAKGSDGSESLATTATDGLSSTDQKRDGDIAKTTEVKDEAVKEEGEGKEAVGVGEESAVV